MVYRVRKIRVPGLLWGTEMNVNREHLKIYPDALIEDRRGEAVIVWGGGCQSQKFWSPFLTPADRAGRRAHTPVALWIPTECRGPALSTAPPVIPFQAQHCPSW